MCVLKCVCVCVRARARACVCVCVRVMCVWCLCGGVEFASARVRATLALTPYLMNTFVLRACSRLGRVIVGRFEDKMEGDPFHASGFITAFSQLNVQQQGAFTLTARTFAGDLAELERILAELELDIPQVIAQYAPLPGTPPLSAVGLARLQIGTCRQLAAHARSPVLQR